MLKIKLARFGKRNQPHYRIVVTEARSKRDGKYTALVGHYAPTQTPKTLEIDVDAYNEWLAKGAQPTQTVAGLFKRFTSGNPFPEKPKRPSKKSLAKAQAEKEAKETAAATPAEEKPAEQPEDTTETPDSVDETETKSADDKK